MREPALTERISNEKAERVESPWTVVQRFFIRAALLSDILGILRIR